MDIQNSAEVTIENKIMLNFISEYDGLGVIQILFMINERINTPMSCIELIQNNKSIEKYGMKKRPIADNRYINLRLDNKLCFLLYSYEGSSSYYIILQLFS